MIAAISMMRRLDTVDIHRFRRHWLDVHGPLVQSFAGLRSYVQCHAIDNPATNAAARALRIDGFPILYFNNHADRQLAQGSAAMAACNIDSRLFIGAVSRVATTPVEIRAGQGGRLSAIVLCLEGTDVPAVQARLSAAPSLTRFDVLEQGPAPASTVPHLPAIVSGVFQIRCESLVELEAAMAGLDVPTFVVEEHWLPPT
ncbi:MAG: EthD family reductase [Rhodospirillales bacterium]